MWLRLSVYYAGIPKRLLEHKRFGYGEFLKQISVVNIQIAPEKVFSNTDISILSR